MASRLSFEASGNFGRAKARFVAEFAETKVGVVLAEQQAIFGAGGEHAVWLDRALGDEVVYEDADIGFVAAEDDGFLS